jgi:aquaporin Z
MKNYLTEAIGTFFLVLTIGLTVVGGTEFAPLAIGAALTALVYMGRHISGAHYNPAVTLAIFMRGKLEGGSVAPYMVSQVAGAFVATLVVSVVMGSTFAPAPSPDATTVAALLVEILYTFALALVVLNVATADATSGNSFYGLAIGFTVAAGAFAGGAVSGGAFNPAVGAGPILAHAILGGGGVGDLWLYLVGPFTGGALAALVFRLQHND